MAIELFEDLTGQTALVTGATRGIGKRIAEELTDLGATVFAGARDVDDIEARDQRPIRLDVTRDGDLEAAVSTIEGVRGQLDVLVNNAGVYGPAAPFGALSSADIERTLRVNLHGPMRLTRTVLPLLQQGESPRVVNVSSGAGQFSGGIDSSHLPYGVSKAGLNAFTMSLAAQYPDLSVNAVCPGWVRTDMGGSGAPRSVEKGAETPVWLARFKRGPSGRFWRDKERIEW